MACLIEMYVEKNNQRKTKGAQLRYDRRKLKMSPLDMAELLEVDRTVIHAIEKGEWIKDIDWLQRLDEQILNTMYWRQAYSIKENNFDSLKEQIEKRGYGVRKKPI